MSRADALVSILSRKNLLCLFPFVCPLFGVCGSRVGVCGPFIVYFLVLFSVYVTFRSDFVACLLVSFKCVSVAGESNNGYSLQREV